MANEGDRTLVRIDPAAREIVGAPLRLPAAPLALAPHPGGVWVALASGAVLRADDTGAIAERVRAAGPRERITAIGADGRRLWVAVESLARGNIGQDPGRIIGVDVASGRVVSRTTLSHAGNVVVAGTRDVWAFSFIESTVTRLDGSTGRRAGRWSVAPGIADAEEAGGKVWFAGRSGLVGWIDVRRPSRQSAPLPVGGRASAISAGAQGVWVTVPDGRLDPR